jgi:hypothetical protein
VRTGYDPLLPTTLLDEAREGWRFAREGVIAELENIPANKFTFSPAPGVRAVAELARHIVESGTVMVGELTRPDGDFTRQSYPKFLKEYAGRLDRRQDKASLIRLLKGTLKTGTTTFRRAGDVLMLQQSSGSWPTAPSRSSSSAARTRCS